jgi:arylsulfatase A-like enzyme
VIVTSDHGEAFYARGYGNHARGWPTTVARSRWPRGFPASPAPRRHRGQVGLVDLLPTLCSYLGIACPAQLTGGA